MHACTTTLCTVSVSPAPPLTCTQHQFAASCCVYRLQQLVVRCEGGVRVRRHRPAQRWRAVNVALRTPTSLASTQTTLRALRCQHISAAHNHRGHDQAALMEQLLTLHVCACVCTCSGPTTVLVLSLAFIGAVVLLHIFGKLAK